MAFAFDGTSSHRVGGAEIVSYGPDGTDVSPPIKLEFP